MQFVAAVLQYVVVALIVLAVGLPALRLPATLRKVAAGPYTVHEPTTLWLIGGLLAGVATCWWVRRSTRVRFVTTLLHELAHMSMALLLGTSPRSLSAGEGAGLFQYGLRGPLPKLRTFFITIAPYFISPLLVAPVVLALLLGPVGDWRLGFLAWLLAVTLTLPLAEIHPRQPDLKRYGVVLPIVAAVWLWAGLAALTLSLVASGSASESVGLYAGSWRWLAELAP